MGIEKEDSKGPCTKHEPTTFASHKSICDSCRTSELLLYQQFTKHNHPTKGDLPTRTVTRSTRPTRTIDTTAT